MEITLHGEENNVIFEAKARETEGKNKSVWRIIASFGRIERSVVFLDDTVNSTRH